VSGRYDMRVRLVRSLRSEGVTTLFIHGAINRSDGRPWASC
jgi:hypothetical protein